MARNLYSVNSPVWVSLSDQKSHCDVLIQQRQLTGIILTEKVKVAFDEEGVSIPYPQRDVHLHQVSG